eukprot:symbB.v1.2.018992.t1/scaffold1501.1/size122984/4
MQVLKRRVIWRWRCAAHKMQRRPSTWAMQMGVLSDSASPFAPLLGRTWGNVKDEETKHEKRANLGNTEREGTGLKLLLQRLCEEEARHSQWPQAMLLLDFLRHRGLKSFPRGIYSSWFLGACGRAGHWSESLKVFHQLKGSTQQQRAILNQVAYECQRGRSWLQAISLLNEIRAQSAQSILLTFEKLGQ